MKITKILLATSLAMLMGACSDDNDLNKNIQPTPGAEVQFGAALSEEAGSRTIYGPENTTDHNFPILWLNGDEVKVMSPGCAVEQAQYAVNLKAQDGTTPESAAYGGTLVKQGDAGIQWGNAPTANFFSVYPAMHVKTMDPASRTVNCHFIHNQNDDYTVNGNTITTKADMKAGFLYAATYGAQNGSSVNLRYKPIATALRFTLRGPSGQTNDYVTISRITLKAPQKIAGDFSLTFPENGGEPTINMMEDDEASYNEINIFSHIEGGTGYLTINRGQTVEFNAFILLAENATLNENWSLEIVTSNNLVFKKALNGTGNGTLVKGQINRLGATALAALDIPSHLDKYDPENWMINIPRNTYLADISIPGSWNSLNPEFQANFTIKNTDGTGTTSLTGTDLITQYNYGARAFHLDCRWKNRSNPTIGYWTSNRQPTLNDLAVANGGETYAVHSGYTALSSVAGRVMNASAPTFADCLTTIVSKVQPREYMVVVCTYAQGSYDNPAKTWMQAISDIAADREQVYDARNLKPTTTVGEVLGQVIVIVNCEGKVTEMDLPKNSKCLFVNAPLTLQRDMFGADNYNKDLLYFTNASATSTGITLNNTQAQVSSDTGSGYVTNSRGYAPTLAERQTTAKSMLDNFRNNYDPVNESYVADNWLYFGLGGYLSRNNAGDAISDSYNTVATSMNDWMKGIVSNMSTAPTGDQTEYFPVGIVLMNNLGANAELADKILQMNNMFQKGYDDSKPAFPDAQGQALNETMFDNHYVKEDAWK